MIYYDKLFTANQKEWAALKIPYVAQSSATNYVILSSVGDFVVDYEVDDVKTIPTVSCGGTFDPRAQAEKNAAVEKQHEIDDSDRREAQSVADGGKPKFVVQNAQAATGNRGGEDSPQPDDRPDEIMGNDLAKDPILF